MDKRVNSEEMKRAVNERVRKIRDALLAIPEELERATGIPASVWSGHIVRALKAHLPK